MPYHHLHFVRNNKPSFAGFQQNNVTDSGGEQARLDEQVVWLAWSLMIVTGSMDREGGAWVNPGLLAGMDRRDFPPAPAGGTRGPGPASRTDLGLPASQQNLLKELAKTGKPLVLVLISGRPLVLRTR